MSATKIAFTICSNNYLGQAAALKDSFLRHNPGYAFYIILVDRLSEQIDYSFFEPAHILPVEHLGLDMIKTARGLGYRLAVPDEGA